MRRLLLAGCLLAASTLLLAQSSGGPYTIRKDDVSGGGTRATGGTYVLTGTAGQPEATAPAGVGTVYRLTGGFHAPAGDGAAGRIFCDSFEAAASCP